MDIDAVYTWVDHTDPDWQRMYREASRTRVASRAEHASVDAISRFTNRDEIYYSIKSLHKHAPWIRRIHVLSNCAQPQWMQAIPDLVFHTHEEVFPDPSVLPTFSSHAIETVLHHLPGLADHFLYLNDDFFICAPVSPDIFFRDDGEAQYFPSRNSIPDADPDVARRPAENREINDARLIERRFGRRPQRKLQHAPYALRRDVLEEIDAAYAPLVAETRRRPFRDANDIGVATTLHAYHAAATSRAAARHVSVRYVDIGDPKFVLLVHPWAPLMRGKYAFLCLNEVGTMKMFQGLRDRIVGRLMSRLFDR